MEDESRMRPRCCRTAEGQAVTGAQLSQRILPYTGRRSSLRVAALCRRSVGRKFCCKISDWAVTKFCCNVGCKEADD